MTTYRYCITCLFFVLSIKLFCMENTQEIPLSIHSATRDLWEALEQRINNHEDPNILATINKALTDGALLTTYNTNNMLPLHSAVADNDLELTALFLKNNADPNILAGQDQDSVTPLHRAILNINPALVELLIKYGALPYLTDTHSITPLQLLDIVDQNTQQLKDYHEQQSLKQHSFNFEQTTKNIKVIRIYLQTALTSLTPTAQSTFPVPPSSTKPLLPQLQLILPTNSSSLSDIPITPRTPHNNDSPRYIYSPRRLEVADTHDQEKCILS